MPRLSSRRSTAAPSTKLVALGIEQTSETGQTFVPPYPRGAALLPGHAAILPAGQVCSAEGPDTDRLHWLTGHLDLEGTPAEGWKLLVADSGTVEVGK